MENDKFFQSGSSPNPLSFGLGSSGMDMQLVGELNCGSSDQQLPNCFLNLNWENSLNQQNQQQQQSSAAFESALSSLVSSPAASNTAGAPGDSVVIRELIGKLGSICNSSEISPQSHSLRGPYLGGGSANNSCYSTPLNSPPKLNLTMMDHQIRGNSTTVPPHPPHHPNPSLAPFPTDPGFAERAARYSCFGNGNYGVGVGGGLTTAGQLRLNESELAYRSTTPTTENGKLSRASSNQSLKTAVVGSQMANYIQEPLQEGLVEVNVDVDVEMELRSAPPSDRKFSRLSRSSTPDNAHEESSASEVIPGENPPREELPTTGMPGSGKLRRKGRLLMISRSLKMRTRMLREVEEMMAVLGMKRVVQ
ncbi:hypothetical protein Sjap_009115 [Stephania japonica]|uniref:Uncharacterized protein n=1 Tax=Stephania japonica TaxID=461633 RepID=A0AAP0PF48_9MAGN